MREMKPNLKFGTTKKMVGLLGYLSDFEMKLAGNLCVDVDDVLDVKCVTQMHKRQPRRSQVVHKCS